MNILETIIAAKRKEVERSKSFTSIGMLMDGPFFKNKTSSLRKSLVESKTGIIAEFKRQSPSKGIINAQATVEEVTKGYTEFGAAGLSVLTDKEYFGGGIEDLLAATINDCPILRKEFIIDEYQLYESKAFGAEVILLIAACLSKKEVKELAGVARQIGLEVLLEIHTHAELDHLCDEVDLVGINNRNLKSFTVDIQRSVELGKNIPSDKIKISESGIDDVETIKMLRGEGFSGFLMGEKFMKEKDPVHAFKIFTQALNP